MDHVPWQVVYGHGIGWTFFLVLTVLGGVLLWAWLRWVARRYAAGVLDELGPGKSTVDLGPMVLRGRIEIPGAPVPALDGSGAAAACTVETSSDVLRFAPRDPATRASFRAPSLHFVMGDDTTELRGRLDVLVGSRHAFPGSLTRLDGEDRERLLGKPDGVICYQSGEWPKDLKVPGTIRTLRHGDEVIVRGEVRYNLGNGGPGASYRPMGTAFEIVPAPGADALDVAVTNPGVLSFGLLSMLPRSFAVGIALSVFVSLVIGGAALRVDDFLTASLFPLHRGAALDALADKAAEGTCSDARLDLVMRYHERSPDCKRTGEALLAHGRFQQAGDMLATCKTEGSKARAVMAYRLAGSFHEACSVAKGLDLKPSRDEVAHLLIGECTEEASTMLRTMAGVDSQAAQAGVLDCLADAIDAREGNQAAMKSLASHGAEACRLLHADLTAGPERTKVLSFLSDAPPSEQARHAHPLLRQLLAFEVQEEQLPIPVLAMPTVLDVFVHPDGFLAGRPNGLEHESLAKLATIADPTDAQRSLRQVLAIRSAGFELLAGNVDDAMSLLDLAEADTVALRVPPETPNAMGAWVQGLRAEAQILSLKVLGYVIRGEPEKALPLFDAWKDLSPSRFLRDLPISPDLSSFLETIRADVVRSIDEASALLTLVHPKTRADHAIGKETLRTLLSPQHGDAIFLPLPEVENPMSMIRSQPSLGLRFVASSGTAGEGAMRVDWVRCEARSSASPVVMMWEVALATRMASALGANELAVEQHAIAQAYRSALNQRRFAVPLAMLAVD